MRCLDYAGHRARKKIRVNILREGSASVTAFSEPVEHRVHAEAKWLGRCVVVLGPYDKKVWEMFLEIEKDLPSEFTINDVAELIHRQRPEVQSNTIRSHMKGCTPNHPSQRYYSLSHKIFYYLGDNKFRLWQSMDSIPYSKESETGQAAELKQPLHAAGEEVCSDLLGSLKREPSSQRSRASTFKRTRK